ncbi:MAG: aminotransferase class I/II-fold pyridoxal phosphate-dependent enzyme [Rhodobacteraceae bacterium]|nr:aminotransferase class I/II-fold pyridoxal phosphate-dependent enzyme [Paracoccaceae bacterium]
MDFPQRLSGLPEYPFSRLRNLLDRIPPGDRMIDLSVGEPRHPFPQSVVETAFREAQGFGRYPPNNGSAGLLQAISDWLKLRYRVDIDSETRLLALNGMREGLFNSGLALCPEKKNGATPAILIPNPFYQVYAAAAAAAGAEPVFVPAVKETGYLPDIASLPTALLQRTAMLYLCSPSNPQGAVAGKDYLQELLRLAERHRFRIMADECYAEIYRGDPPVGLLEVAVEIGADPELYAIFHSLSKRSNLPGLRSGFMAGGPQSIAAMKKLKAYAGAPIPTPLLAASAEAWSDESHVETSREAYRVKFQLADEILGGFAGYRRPEAGFFLWLNVGDGESTTVRLWSQTGLRVLPGAYLGRTENGVNPGSDYIRVALVTEIDELRVSLERLRGCI